MRVECVWFIRDGSVGNTELCSGSETGSYLRLIDSCITQLKVQGPSRTCNESEEEEDLHEDDGGSGIVEVRLSLSHTHTHSLSLSHTHTDTHTLSLSLTHTHSLSLPARRLWWKWPR